MNRPAEFSTANASTREQLLDAAETLFLQKGLDAVSLREIARHSGQRNTSALQYHFGGREGLIDALLDRRMEQLELRRRDLMAQVLAGNPDPAVRDCCALLVRAPFLVCRERADFRELLGLLGPYLLASDQHPALMARNERLPSLKAMHERLGQLLCHLPDALLRLRVENVQGMALLAISGRARRGDSFRGPRAELFYNNLVDQVTAMLTADIAPDTQAALAGIESRQQHQQQ